MKSRIGNRLVALFIAALIGGAALSLVMPGVYAPEVYAQGQPQSLAAVRVDFSKLQTGYRASKVTGAAVVNETGERIGTVDDIIVARDGRESYAVLSIGGFLGVGDHLVAVPYSQLMMDDNRIMLHGATKDVLKSLPEYRYNR